MSGCFEYLSTILFSIVSFAGGKTMLWVSIFNYLKNYDKKT